MKEKQLMPIYMVAGIAVLTLIFTVMIMIKIGKIKPEEEKIKIVRGTEEMGPTYSLGEFIVNLRDGGYVKTDITIELDAPIKQKDKKLRKEEEEKGKKLTEEIKIREPQIRETIIKVLSSNSLSNLQGPQGIENLKILLLESIQLVLGGGKLELKMNEKGQPEVEKTRSNIEYINIGSKKIRNVYITLLQTE